MKSWVFYPCLAIVAALLLSGCESTKKDTYIELPVDRLYNDAMNSVVAGNWDKAAQQFEEVDRQPIRSGRPRHS